MVIQKNKNLITKQQMDLYPEKDQTKEEQPRITTNKINLL